MPPVRDSRAAAPLVLLVTAAVFINYIDRGNLATAAPLIQSQFNMSASQLGVLLSAFYYGYVTCMPATGWLAERYGAHKVLAIGVTIWSLATFTTGFATSFAMLMVLRIALGVGESVGFPCASKLIASAVDISRLGVANGILSFGYLLGPAVGTYIGGKLMTIYGWRPVFLMFGALSLLWLIPWLRFVRGWTVNGAPLNAQPESKPAGPPEEPPPSFGIVLRQRALWGASLGHFASNYGYYFILSWLPFYLVKARGFSVGTMAEIASWAYLLNAVAALLMGWAADRWIRAGRSPTLIYKGIMGLSHLGAIACMGGMVLLPESGSIASLYTFEVISGFSYPGLFAIAQILAGPTATGRWVGVQNAAGNIAGLIAPAITGFLVDRTGNFTVAFALTAAVNVFGFIGWVFVLPEIAPLRWTSAAAPAEAAPAT
jgi:MFS family permease